MCAINDACDDKDECGKQRLKEERGTEREKEAIEQSY